mgnify:CR=1 FL=1
MNVADIEREHPHFNVIKSPDEANLLFDSMEKTCVRINGWVEHSDSYRVAIQDGQNIETVTVPKYIQQSNKYYFIQSESFLENR